MRLQITEPEVGGGEGGEGHGSDTDIVTPAPWPAHPRPLKDLGALQGSGLRDRDWVGRVGIMPCGSCQRGRLPVTTTRGHWD